MTVAYIQILIIVPFTRGTDSYYQLYWISDGRKLEREQEQFNIAALHRVNVN